MARNRVAEDRDVKRNAIVHVARELFVRDGYEATPMAALARAAGVAPNTIYWYFEDKDAVLLAVVSQVVAAARAEYDADPPRSLVDQLLWLVAVFERMDRLTVTIHSRAQVSASVAGWHKAFHAASDRWLIHQVRSYLAQRPVDRAPADRAGDQGLAAIPKIWSYAIEGMIAHGVDPDERRVLCETLVRQLDAL